MKSKKVMNMIPIVREKLKKYNLEPVGDLNITYDGNKKPFQVKYPNGQIRNMTWQRLRDGNIYRGNPKYTLDDVKIYAKTRKLKCISKEYVNSHTKMKFKCKLCGNKYESTFENLYKKKENGCEKCGKKIVKYSWTYIEKIYEDANCGLASEESEYKNQHSYLQFICECGEIDECSFKEFKNGQRCSHCSDSSRAETNLEKYGHVNVLASDYGKEKTKEFYMKHYGVDHNSKVSSIQEKKVETCMKNFGISHGFCAPYVYEKLKEINKEKYGCDYPLQSKEILDKCRETCMENLGVLFPLQSKDVHDKIKKNNKKKYGHTNFLASEAGKELMLELYGHTNFLASEAGKELMVERYGVENAMQNSEIFAKAMRNSFKTKNYTLPSGTIIYVQGYEHFALDDLLTVYDEKEIYVSLGKNVPLIKYEFNGKNNCTYHPDIYIERKNLLIEVKSIWTYFLAKERNDAKARACICQGYKYQVRIYNRKGKMISCIVYSLKDDIVYENIITYRDDSIEVTYNNGVTEDITKIFYAEKVNDEYVVKIPAWYNGYRLEDHETKEHIKVIIVKNNI